MYSLSLGNIALTFLGVPCTYRHHSVNTAHTVANFVPPSQKLHSSPDITPLAPFNSWHDTDSEIISGKLIIQRKR